MTTNSIKDKIKALRTEYDQLRKGKRSLLMLIDETELSESVFNSNAIENSTLANFAKSRKKSIHAFLNAARRQTISAFREKGVWKISKESK